MSDFQLNGEVRIDQGGLSSFEKAAEQSGQKAGKSLAEGIQQGTRDTAKQLQQALDQGASKAKESGQKIGSGIATGVTTEVRSKVPTAITEALKSTEAQGKASGKTIGTNVTRGVGDSVRTEVPKQLQLALRETSSVGQQSGKDLGKGISSGTSDSLLKLLPPAFADALAKPQKNAASAGTAVGTKFGGGIATGTKGNLNPALAGMFDKAKGQAGTEGNKTGTAFGQALKSGVDSQRALFNTVVEQAERAAKKADLIFDSTTLEFRYPNGGLVPQQELDRLAKLDSSVKEAGLALEKLKGSATGVAAPMRSAGAGVQNLVQQSSVLDGVVIGLTATLSGSLLKALGALKSQLFDVVGGFAALDKQVRLATAATGEGEAGYNTLKAAIDRTGIEAAATQMEIAELATELTRAGFTAKQTAEIMPAVSRGAEGTGTAFATMASLVGASLKQFGLEVEEAARVTDVLVKSSTSASTTVEQMGEALKYAGPVANALGVSLEDTVAALSMMGNAGINATVAGTGLRTMLQRLQMAARNASNESFGLQKGQEKLGEALRILGAEVTNADGSLKPLDQTLKTLKATFSNFDKGAQVELATVLFGEQGATKFLGLVNQSEQDIESMFQTIRNSKGATDTAKEAMNGLQQSFDELGGTIDVLKGQFGKVIGTAIRPFVQALTLAIDTINMLPGPVKDLLTVLATLTTTYVAAKTAVLVFNAAMANSSFASAINGIKALGAALKANIASDLAKVGTLWKTFIRSVNTVNFKPAITQLTLLKSSLKASNFKAAGTAAVNFGKTLLGVGPGAKQLTLNIAGIGKEAAKTGPAMTQLGLNIAGAGNNATVLTAGGGKLGAMLAKLGPIGAKAGTMLGGLGSALAGAALACPPLTAALAAVATSVVSYNVIMGKSREVTAALQPAIDDISKSAEKAGIKFEDFGKQGGPFAEAMRGSGDALKVVGDRLREIPIVGKLASTAWNGLVTALKNTPFGLAIQGVTGLVKWLKNLYDEAARNQAIIELRDQVEQFDEVAQKTGQQSQKLTNELKALGTTGSAEEIARLGKETSKTATEMNKQIKAAEGMAQKLREMAAAARQRGEVELAEAYEREAAGLDASARLLTVQRDKMLDAAKATKAGTEAVKEYTGSIDETTQKLIGLQNAINGLDLATNISTASLELTKERGNLLQSQYDLGKAYWQAELKHLEKIDGSEAQKAALKQKIHDSDAAAWRAEFANYERQMQHEQQILSLKQEQQRLEADAAVIDAKIKAAEAEIALAEAQKEGNEAKIQAAQNLLGLANQQVDALEAQRGSLEQIQGIEREILGVQQQTKQNQLEAKGIVEGYGQVIRGNAQATADQANATGLVAQGWSNTANSMGGVVTKSEMLANGTIRIWQETNKVQGAYTGIANTDIAQPAINAAGAMSNFNTQATSAQNGVMNIQTGLQNTVSPADALSQNMGGMRESSDGMAQNLANAQAAVANTDASALAGDLYDAAINAGGTATNVNNISQIDLSSVEQPMQNAAIASDAIANSGMESAMSKTATQSGRVAGEMSSAASSAGDFYRQLAAASSLPGSRWTGGPVSSGAQYRVNELGQEAFLANSGRLSLINKPANALWRAPSKGVVIPAGVTEGLKQRGVFQRGNRSTSVGSVRGGGNSAGMAEQAAAIGKLQQSVDELVRKDWNVQVKVRNSEGSSALNVLNRMRA